MLETIWGRSVNRVHVLDFAGLTEGMRQTLGDQLRMVYTRDEGQELFTSHAWRRLFEIRALLVREFILEFLSTCRMSDTEMGLDIADTLCFQLGGARRRMTWSERVIPNKGDLRDYWIEISSDRDFLGLAPSYVFIRDPVRRLCHKMIYCSISGRGQVPEKVTGVDLFYLRSMDRGTANIPYLLAQYLFKHDDGMKSGARLSGGYFIGCLAAHFGQFSDQGLRGLSMVTHELPLIDLHELGRLNICVRVVDTWAWADPTPVQAPQSPPHAPRTMQQRISRLEKEVQELRRSIVGCEEILIDRSLIMAGLLPGWQLVVALPETYQT
ncbi:hypothetical protein Tco_1332896 [Tanacetum coccineum]